MRSKEEATEERIKLKAQQAERRAARSKQEAAEERSIHAVHEKQRRGTRNEDLIIAAEKMQGLKIYSV